MDVSLVCNRTLLYAVGRGVPKQKKNVTWRMARLALRPSSRWQDEQIPVGIEP